MPSFRYPNHAAEDGFACPAGSAEAYDGVALLTGAGGSMALLTDDDQSDELLRETIATALRVVADRVCREHVASITQEHQITSRIGEALTLSA